MDKIARLFAEISADNSKFKSTMNQTDGMLKSTSGRFNSFFTGIVQGFGQAFGQATIRGIREVGSAFAGVIGSAANTEQQVADIQSILQATTEEGQQIKQLLNDLAVNPKLKVSLAEAGSLTEMLARNGVATKDIIDGMAKSTILLSNATKGDYAQAADILTDVMALWKELGLNQEDAINSITSVTNKSKLNLNEYQYAIANVAGSASNLKIPFQDVNAALIATASYFKSGRTQGTSFDAFLTRLVPTTDAAKEAFDQLGLRVNGVNQLFDETGTLKDFGKIAGMLRTAIKDLTDEQAIELLSGAFGRTAADFLLGISKVGEEGFQAIKMEASKVSAEVNAAVVTDTTLAKWNTFKDTLVGIGNLIGDKFLPDLKKLISGLLDLVTLNRADFVGAFDGLAESFQNFVSYILSNQNSIAKGISNFISGLTNVINNIPTFISWLIAAKKNVLDFSTAIYNVVSPAIEFLKKAFEGITNGVTFSSFRGLFDTLASEGLSPSAITQLKHLGTSIITIVSNALTLAYENILKPALRSLMDFLTSDREFQSIGAIAQTLYSALTKGFSDESTIAQAKKAFQLVLEDISKLVNMLWDFVGPYLTEYWNNFYNWFTDSARITDLKNGLIASWTFVSEWAKYLWESISPTLNEVWKNITSYVTDSSKRTELLNSLKTHWTSFTDWANELWQTTYPILKSYADNLYIWVDDKSDGFLTKFVGWKNAFVGWLSDVKTEWNRIFPELKRITDEIYAPIVANIGGIISKFNDLLDYPRSHGPQSIQDWGNLMTAIYNIVGSTLNAITSSLNVLLGSINLLQDALSALNRGDLGAFAQIQNDFNNLMGSLQNTPIETIAQWMDPLYWLGLRPDSPIENQTQSQTGLIPNNFSPNVSQDITVTLTTTGGSMGLSREQLEELSILLGRSLNLQGVRVNP